MFSESVFMPICCQFFYCSLVVQPPGILIPISATIRQVNKHHTSDSAIFCPSIGRLLHSCWVLLIGCTLYSRKAAKKWPNIQPQPIEEKAELPIGYRKRVNFRSFSLKRCISVYIHKNQRHIRKC